MISNNGGIAFDPVSDLLTDGNDSIPSNNAFGGSEERCSVLVGHRESRRQRVFRRGWVEPHRAMGPQEI